MLNPNDPYYIAERTPSSIAAMEHPLCDHYGVGLGNFGAKGNEYHDYGFHRSRRWIMNSPDSRHGSDDYSIRDQRNKGGNADNVCAFDFTPGEWGTTDNRNKMIQITKNLLHAAERNDPRLSTAYEFAGTIDGKTVITFAAQGGARKSPFDSTHLDHVHGSFWRDNSDNDHMGIVDVMLHGSENDMGAASFLVRLRTDKANSIVIPPVEQGGADPAYAWLNLGADSFGKKVGYRVFYSTGAKNWAPLKGTADPQGTNKLDENGLIALASGERFSVSLPPGTFCLSVTVMGVDDAGKVVPPDAAHPAYDGDLSIAIERLAKR